MSDPTLPDFSHLREISGSSRRTYTIVEMDGMPQLELAPATRQNVQYLRGLLAHREAMQRCIEEFGVDSAEFIELQQAADRDIYPGNVIKGWTGVKDAKGQEVPFSLEVCAHLMQHLPGDWFDRMRGFAGIGDNFRDVPELSQQEAVALGED